MPSSKTVDSNKLLFTRFHVCSKHVPKYVGAMSLTIKVFHAWHLVGIHKLSALNVQNINYMVMNSVMQV
jgi:hypothetical protein